MEGQVRILATHPAAQPHPPTHLTNNQTQKKTNTPPRNQFRRLGSRNRINLGNVKTSDQNHAQRRFHCKVPVT